jgi:hypothetical protein
MNMQGEMNIRLREHKSDWAICKERSLQKRKKMDFSGPLFPNPTTGKLSTCKRASSLV